jgi:hypothetical protein
MAEQEPPGQLAEAVMLHGYRESMYHDMVGNAP